MREINRENHQLLILRNLQWKKGEGSASSSRIFTYTSGEKLPSFITVRNDEKSEMI